MDTINNVHENAEKSLARYLVDGSTVRVHGNAPAPVADSAVGSSTRTSRSRGQAAPQVAEKSTKRPLDSSSSDDSAAGDS